METAILIAAVLVGVIACPLMMWWQRRRGRDSVCCSPASAGQGGGSGELAELRQSQVLLSARLAELQGEEAPVPLSVLDESAHR